MLCCSDLTAMDHPSTRPAAPAAHGDELNPKMQVMTGSLRHTPCHQVAKLVATWSDLRIFTPIRPAVPDCASANTLPIP